MREFSFELSDSKISGEFKLNGKTFTVKKAKTARIAHLVAAIGKGSDTMETMARVFEFMSAVLPEDQHKAFEEILLELDLEEAMEIFNEVLTLAAQDPTPGASSASSPSRKTTGTTSRAKSASAAV